MKRKLAFVVLFGIPSIVGYLFGGWPTVGVLWAMMATVFGMTWAINTLMDEV